MPPSPLIFHDMFLNPDGGGKVAVTLARAFNDRLMTGHLDANAFPDGWFGSISPVSPTAYDAYGVHGAFRLALPWLKFSKILQMHHAVTHLTSELYGKAQEVPQTETTPFYPRSPYAAAKLYAYWITVNYREAYGMYACNGILFNHESPVRGETFVTRKITRAAARIALGLQKTLYLGNLNAKRDWGHARDYVRMQWMMLQQEKPEDYVIATGKQHSIREFCDPAFGQLGIVLGWEGEGVREKGIVNKIDEKPHARLEIDKVAANVGEVVVRVDSRYFRPTEVDSLLGDPSKAREKLGWVPEISFPAMVREMLHADVFQARRDRLCNEHGFEVCDYHE